MAKREVDNYRRKPLPGWVPVAGVAVFAVLALGVAAYALLLR
jgi:hypothetical protein